MIKNIACILVFFHAFFSYFTNLNTSAFPWIPKGQEKKAHFSPSLSTMVFCGMYICELEENLCHTEPSSTQRPLMSIMPIADDMPSTCFSHTLIYFPSIFFLLHFLFVQSRERMEKKRQWRQVGGQRWLLPISWQ